MDKEEYKDKVFSQLAKIPKALANPYRLRIIELIAQGGFTVEEIARETHLSIANASQHLQVLKNIHLVEVKRNGHYRHYRLANSEVFQAWQTLRDFGMKRMAEIERVVNDFRGDKHRLQTITIDNLLPKLENENIVFLDVRPKEEYSMGHLPKALSIPFEELETRLEEIVLSQTIIAYCRGPFCVFADDAVQLLTKKGFNAYRLEEGFPDWKYRDLPYEITAN